MSLCDVDIRKGLSFVRTAYCDSHTKRHIYTVSRLYKYKHIRKHTLKRYWSEFYEIDRKQKKTKYA